MGMLSNLNNKRELEIMKPILLSASAAATYPTSTLAPLFSALPTPY